MKLENKIKSIIKYIILILFVFLFSFIYSKTYVKHSMYDTNLDNADWLKTSNTNDTIIQNFCVDENHINGVQLQLDFVGGDLSGFINIEVLDSNDKVLKKTKLNYSNINPGRFNYIYFNKKLNIIPNKNYKIKLSQSSNDEMSGVLYSYTNTNLKNKMLINNKENGNMVLRTLTYRFNFETFIICNLFIFFIFAFMSILFKLFKA